MNITGGNFPSIEQITNQYLNIDKSIQNNGIDKKDSFAEIFKQKQISSDNSSNVKFSKHASLRLNDRNIELSKNQLERLNAGTQKASEKGINESLVLMDQMAFIVNVKNNTVITAMNGQEMKDNVFTNIDGAIIV